MKTSDLTGAALDWAVAKCEGQEISQANLGFQSKTLGGIQKTHGGAYSPSTDWAQGGVILEREKISLASPSPIHQHWTAMTWLNQAKEDGPTPLIAAMRCFCASRLGNEVEIPKEMMT